MNKIHIPETTAWIKGTEIKINAQDFTVGLSDSGTKFGRVKLVLDWSQPEPASFAYEVAASATGFDELTQDEDINFAAGIWEEVFATYTCTEASISDVVFSMTSLPDAGGSKLIANVESGTASQPYQEGEYIVYGGVLRKVISPIAIGDTITPGSNVEATSTNVSTELFRLNSDSKFMDTSKILFDTGSPSSQIKTGTIPNDSVGFLRFLQGGTNATSLYKLFAPDGTEVCSGYMVVKGNDTASPKRSFLLPYNDWSGYTYYMGIWQILTVYGVK